MIVKTPSTITNFFSEDCQLSISPENGVMKVHTKDFERVLRDTHRREIEKILVVCYNVHYVNSSSIVMIIGQICYEDVKMIRFVENLIIDDNNRITSCIVRFLNEEIVYSKEDKKMPTGYVNSYIIKPEKVLFIKQGARLNYRDVIENFGRYGKINAYERKKNSVGAGEDAFIEFELLDALERVVADKNILREKGIIVEPERKYYKENIFEKKRY
ncbi:hypothetical protein GVAV_000882 [Gurleya vavrai]